MRTYRKRILSMLLAVVLIVGLLAVPVSAETVEPILRDFANDTVGSLPATDSFLTAVSPASNTDSNMAVIDLSNNSNAPTYEGKKATNGMSLNTTGSNFTLDIPADGTITFVGLTHQTLRIRMDRDNGDNQLPMETGAGASNTNIATGEVTKGPHTFYRGGDNRTICFIHFVPKATYAITGETSGIDFEVKGEKVEVAGAGDEVTVVATDPEKSVTDIEVKQTENNSPVTSTGDTFTMPAAAVTVTATLVTRVTATGVGFNPTSLTLEADGTKTGNIAVALTPSNATDKATVTNSNNNVATWANGVVTSKGQIGVTTLTATVSEDISATANVYVVGPDSDPVFDADKMARDEGMAICDLPYNGYFTIHTSLDTEDAPESKVQAASSSTKFEGNDLGYEDDDGTIRDFTPTNRFSPGLGGTITFTTTATESTVTVWFGENVNSSSGQQRDFSLDSTKASDVMTLPATSNAPGKAVFTNVGKGEHTIAMIGGTEYIHRIKVVEGDDGGDTPGAATAAKLQVVQPGDYMGSAYTGLTFAKLGLDVALNATDGNQLTITTDLAKWLAVNADDELKNIPPLMQNDREGDNNYYVGIGIQKPSGIEKWLDTMYMSIKAGDADVAGGAKKQIGEFGLNATQNGALLMDWWDIATTASGASAPTEVTYTFYENEQAETGTALKFSVERKVTASMEQVVTVTGEGVTSIVTWGKDMPAYTKNQDQTKYVISSTADLVIAASAAAGKTISVEEVKVGTTVLTKDNGDYTFTDNVLTIPSAKFTGSAAGDISVKFKAEDGSTSVDLSTKTVVISKGGSPLAAGTAPVVGDVLTASVEGVTSTDVDFIWTVGTDEQTDKSATYTVKEADIGKPISVKAQAKADDTTKYKNATPAATTSAVIAPIPEAKTFKLSDSLTLMKAVSDAEANKALLPDQIPVPEGKIWDSNYFSVATGSGENVTYRTSGLLEVGKAGTDAAIEFTTTDTNKATVTVKVASTGTNWGDATKADNWSVIALKKVGGTDQVIKSVAGGTTDAETPAKNSRVLKAKDLSKIGDGGESIGTPGTDAVYALVWGTTAYELTYELEPGTYQLYSPAGFEKVDRIDPASRGFRVTEITVSETSSVAPTRAVSSITVSAPASTDVTALAAGDEVQLSATIAPADMWKLLTWSSSNENAVTVDATGKITAVAAGSADITATSLITGTAKDAITVTVGGSSNPESLSGKTVVISKGGSPLAGTAPVVGDVLTASVAGVTSTDVDFIWTVGTVEQTDKGATYTVKAADVGKTISVKAKAKADDTTKYTGETAPTTTAEVKAAAAQAVTYTLTFDKLTDAQRAAIILANAVTEALGDDGGTFFTVYSKVTGSGSSWVTNKAHDFEDGSGTLTNAISFGGNASYNEDEDHASGAIGFTLTDEADIKVWYVGDGTADKPGRIVVLGEEYDEAASTNDIASNTYGIAELHIAEAGTYYVGAAKSADGTKEGKARIFKIAVTTTTAGGPECNCTGPDGCECTPDCECAACHVTVTLGKTGNGADDFDLELTLAAGATGTLHKNPDGTYTVYKGTAVRAEAKLKIGKNAGDYNPVTYASNKVSVEVDEDDGTFLASDDVTITATITKKTPGGDPEITGLSFETAGPVSKTYGDGKFTNAATAVTDPTGTAVTVTYSAGTEGVASVNQTTGEVSILKAGSTTITATATINGVATPSETDGTKKTATYTLNVGKATPPAMTLEFPNGSPVAASITEIPVKVTVGDRIADDAKPVVTCVGSDQIIELTTTDQGKTYTGKATILANPSETDEVKHEFTLAWSDINNYESYNDTATHEVVQQVKGAAPIVSGVEVTGPAAVKVDEEKELTATITMSDPAVSYTGEVTWTVTGTAAELVDGNKIKGVSVGEVTVTASAGGKTSEPYTIAVTSATTPLEPLSEIKVNKDTVSVVKGSKTEVSITTTPEEYDDTILVAVDDAGKDKVSAEVSKDGSKVTIRGLQVVKEAKVTLYSENDPEVKAEITVTVTNNSGGGGGGASGGGGSSSGGNTTTTTSPDGTTTTTTTTSDGTKTETVTSPDGTKTETVTKKDGSKTEKVTEPDGTVTETVTETDGTKSETVTKADGTKSEKVTEPNGTVTVTKTKASGAKSETVKAASGDVTVTATASNGEVVAKVEIPAVVPTLSYTFEDVPAGHWAASAINTMAALSVVKGVNEESHVFDMDSNITRGSMAQILFNLSNGKEGKLENFVDVAEGAWYTDAIAWAADAGIVTGYSENSFGPEDSITREQLAVMLYRYADLLGLDSAVSGTGLDGFDDAGSVSSWATNAMAWAVSNGLIKGKGENNLDPAASASRAETAVILERFLDLMK